MGLIVTTMMCIHTFTHNTHSVLDTLALLAIWSTIRTFFRM